YAAAVLIVTQMGLIALLLVQRARRRRSEIALRHNEARDVAFRRAMPDLMFLMTRSGVYLDYHARDPHDLLVPPDRFLGRRLRDVMPPDLVVSFERAFERTLETDQPQEVEYTLTLNGQLRHFEGRIVRCEDDKVLSIVRDITSRKQAEAALQQ